MDEQQYLTVLEVAEHLRVNPESVRRWLRDGNLAGVNLGRAGWRISSDSLQEFLDLRSNRTGIPVSPEDLRHLRGVE